MIENNIEKNQYKIVLYGDNLAGITTSIRKYLYDTFDPDYTYRNCFFEKKMQFEHQKEILILFWDLYHHYNYESLNNIFIKELMELC